MKISRLFVFIGSALLSMHIAYAAEDTIKTRYGDITIKNNISESQIAYEGKDLLEPGYAMDSFIEASDIYQLGVADLVPMKLAPTSGGYSEFDHFIVSVTPAGATLIRDKNMYSADPEDYAISNNEFTATYGKNKLSYDGKRITWNKTSLPHKFTSKDCDYMWQNKEAIIESSTEEYPAQWYISTIHLYEKQYQNFTVEQLVKALSSSKTQQAFARQYCQ